MAAGIHRASAAALLVRALALTGVLTLFVLPVPSAQADSTVVSDWAGLSAAFSSASSSGTTEIALQDNAHISETTGANLALGGGASVVLDLRGGVVEIGLLNAVPDSTPAIHVSAGTSLTIKDTVGNGQLTVKGGGMAAGIGTKWDGDSHIDGGAITIQGGKVTATGGTGSGGIGGGCTGASTDTAAGDGGVIAISGGTVTATGGGSGAGIGGGGSPGLPSNIKQGGAAGTITIGSAVVTATGGTHAAGIGSGQMAWGGSITINSGTVSGTGGGLAAGIGGGYRGTLSAIVINGGDVTARAGDLAAGIGSGESGNDVAVSVKIAGGSVLAYGGNQGAGIGGGSSTSGGTISLTGGTVEARGGGWGRGVQSGQLYPGLCGWLVRFLGNKAHSAAHCSASWRRLWPFFDHSGHPSCLPEH